MKTKANVSKYRLNQYEDNFASYPSDSQQNYQMNQDPNRYSSKVNGNFPINDQPFNTENLNQVSDLNQNDLYKEQNNQSKPDNNKKRAKNIFSDNIDSNHNQQDNFNNDNYYSNGLDHYNNQKQTNKPEKRNDTNSRNRMTNIFNDNTNINNNYMNVNSNLNSNYTPTHAQANQAQEMRKYNRENSIEAKMNAYNNPITYDRNNQQSNNNNNKMQQNQDNDQDPRHKIKQQVNAVNNHGQHNEVHRSRNVQNSHDFNTNTNNDYINNFKNDQFSNNYNSNSNLALNLDKVDQANGNNSKLALLNKKLKNKDTFRHKLLSKERNSTNYPYHDRQRSLDKFDKENINVRTSHSNVPEDQVSNSSITNNAKRTRSQSNNGSQVGNLGNPNEHVETKKPRKVNAGIQDAIKHNNAQRDAFNNLQLDSNNNYNNSNNYNEQPYLQMNNKPQNRNKNANPYPSESPLTLDNPISTSNQPHATPTHRQNKPPSTHTNRTHRNNTQNPTPHHQAKQHSQVERDIDQLNINGHNETNDIPEQAEVRLTECQDCGRKFRPDALERHAKVCTKVFKEKRKVFDTKQVRNADINQELEKLEGFAKQNLKNKKKTDRNQNNNSEKPSSANRERPLKKVPKWKLQSEQFRRALNVGKGSDAVSGYDMKGLPPQYEEEDDRQQCPFCNRKFAPDTLTRHRKFCEDKLKSKGSMKFKAK